MTTHTLRTGHSRWSVVLVLFLVFSPIWQVASHAQTSEFPPSSEGKADSLAQVLRLEQIEVAGGAELITVHANLRGIDSVEGDNWVPLVSILRDTLGDSTKENDRLRYVWPLTYTTPTIKQRMAAAIPFFYGRIGSKGQSKSTPPPALDLAAPEKEVWNKLFWTALQNILLDAYGIPLKASTNTYRRNTYDYRKSHIIRALSVLTLYEAVKGESAFSEREMAEMQARLLLTDKPLGGLVDQTNLESFYAKSISRTRDERGHNWELLRQRAEAESLYFEPLTMPDNSATHALLWVSKEDLAKNQGASYSGRFLNIANPWTDKRLLNWQGYSETRYFDESHQPVSPNAQNAKAVEMIPLAIYGLDNPKIPTVLVDFRDTYNPKKREMSRRVLNDLTRNVLAISKFGNIPYFLGRTVFDFVTGRRGIDINQPSRIHAYSQLKLLLALNESLDPKLSQEVNGRLEHVTLNPFENDLQSEMKIAREQYKALVEFAKDPSGLAAKLERDRRAELTPLEHGTTAQIFFRVANLLTFGKYVHREQRDNDMENRLDIARRLNYHTTFLRQVARSSVEVEVAWSMEEIRRSLTFIADHGDKAGGSAASATAKIFSRTKDDEIRRACLESLSRIQNNKAKTELLKISQNPSIDQIWRDIATANLTRIQEKSQPIAATVSGSAVSGAALRAGQP